MKSPQKLQEKLVRLLNQTPALKVLPSHDRPWDDREFREVAWIVQDFVNQNHSVIESDDPLREWLDEYRFFRADSK